MPEKNELKSKGEKRRDQAVKEAQKITKLKNWPASRLKKMRSQVREMERGRKGKR